MTILGILQNCLGRCISHKGAHVQSWAPTRLQGEFYSWAAFGYGLNATLLGRPVAADGGMKATLSEATQLYANEVAQDEINHVCIQKPPVPSWTTPQASPGTYHAPWCHLISCLHFVTLQHSSAAKGGRHPIDGHSWTLAWPPNTDAPRLRVGHQCTGVVHGRLTCCHGPAGGVPALRPGRSCSPVPHPQCGLGVLRHHQRRPGLQGHLVQLLPLHQRPGLPAG